MKEIHNDYERFQRYAKYAIEILGIEDRKELQAYIDLLIRCEQEVRLSMHVPDYMFDTEDSVIRKNDPARGAKVAQRVGIL